MVMDIWTTTRARLSLLDINIGMSARFYAYITEKSHTKNVMYFLDWGCTRTLRHLYDYAIKIQYCHRICTKATVAY